MPRKIVTGCICHNRSFEEIKIFAMKNSLNSVEELRNRNYCGCGCGLCNPYIELVLETGETEFEPGEFRRRNRNQS